MEPTAKYLTLFPSTSTNRSILAEPLECGQKPSERSQEPPERGSAEENSEERSQEPSEQDSAEEKRKITLDRIAELRRSKISWEKIGEILGISPEVCAQMWDERKSQPRRVKSRAPSVQGKPWDPSEDEILLRLRDEGARWDKVTASIPGRSQNACQMRLFKLRSETEKTTGGPSRGYS